MVDRADLRKLAEALVSPRWEHGFPLPNKDTAEKFEAAASPEVVLGLLDEIDEAVQEIRRLRSLCDAAALEITDHWDAHCDDQGCGPVNLLDRLEQERGGGYIDEFTAEHIKRTLAERDQLRAEVERQKAWAQQTALADVAYYRAMAVRLKGALENTRYGGLNRVDHSIRSDAIAKEALADPEVEKL